MSTRNESLEALNAMPMGEFGHSIMAVGKDALTTMDQMMTSLLQGSSTPDAATVQKARHVANQVLNLMRLALARDAEAHAAETPAAPPAPSQQEGSALQDVYLATAQELKQVDGDTEFDEDAKVSVSEENGAYVQSWAWIADDDVCTFLAERYGKISGSTHSTSDLQELLRRLQKSVIAGAAPGQQPAECEYTRILEIDDVKDQLAELAQTMDNDFQQLYGQLEAVRAERLEAFRLAPARQAMRA